MKRKVVILLTLCSMLSLTACDADNINNTVKVAGEKVGVEVNLNLEQEDLDKIEETVKDGVNKAKDVITDEDVHESVRDLVDSVTEAADKSTEE